MKEFSKGLADLSDLLETLAAIEHERWSHWQRYLHSQCIQEADGSLTIPANLVERWTVQMQSPYSALSEKEKESDREQVRRYLDVVSEALAGWSNKNGAAS